ncbi:MAG: thioesterase domain-containing protein [Planctomycetota bacterium]
MKTNLESQLQFELPMSELMDGPSVLSLSRFAADALALDGDAADDRSEPVASPAKGTQDAATDTSLITMEQRGELPPLFCFHPIGGDLRCYVPLVRELGGKRPIHAPRAVGMNKGETPVVDLAGMTRQYCEAIRRLQPAGPYQLTGWSTGGIFAYEAARHLREDGCDVKLVFIDTPTATVFSKVDLQDDARFLYDLVNFSNWFSGANIHVDYGQLRAMETTEAIDHILHEARDQGVLAAGTTRADLQRRIDVCRAHVQALLHYRPSSYGQRVLLVRPDQTGVLSMATGQQFSDDLGWQAILGDDLELIRVPGDHFSMLTDPYAGRLAEAVHDYLERSPRSPQPQGADQTNQRARRIPR